MNIGIDMRPALTRKTGVGNYIFYLTAHLLRLDSLNRYFLFSSSWKDRFAPEVDWPGRDNVTLVDRKIPVTVLNYLWHRHRFPSLDRLCGTAFHITHSPTPLILPGKKSKKIVTVHDLYFLIHPEHTRGEVKRDYASLVTGNLAESDAVIFNSEATRDEVLERLQISPAVSRVIRPGVPDTLMKARSDKQTDGVKTKFKIRGKFLLHVGTIEPRKNIPLLVEALHHLDHSGFQDLQLILAGDAGWGMDAVQESIRRNKVEDRVRLTGYVDEDALAALYREAALLVYPSRWEGFGMPLLEAMAVGLPAVIFPVPALMELAGEQGALVCREKSSEGLAGAIAGLLDDEKRRESLSAAGKNRSRLFQWETAAESMLQLYEEIYHAGR